MNPFPPTLITAAQAAQKKWSVPASITLAQWALESGFGRHMPTGSNNPFGIKASQGHPFVYAKTHEVYGGRSVVITAKFRKFVSIAEAFDYHAELLDTHAVYRHAMSMKANPDEFAEALTGVYATDPHYGASLISMMHAHNLYQYNIQE